MSVWRQRYWISGFVNCNMQIETSPSCWISNDLELGIANLCVCVIATYNILVCGRDFIQGTYLWVLYRNAKSPHKEHWQLIDWLFDWSFLLCIIYTAPCPCKPILEQRLKIEGNVWKALVIVVTDCIIWWTSMKIESWFWGCTKYHLQGTKIEPSWTTELKHKIVQTWFYLLQSQFISAVEPIEENGWERRTLVFWFSLGLLKVDQFPKIIRLETHQESNEGKVTFIVTTGQIILIPNTGCFLRLVPP